MGKASGCYTSIIHRQRCQTRGESQGKCITYASAKCVQQKTKKQCKQKVHKNKIFAFCTFFNIVSGTIVIISFIKYIPPKSCEIYLYHFHACRIRWSPVTVTLTGGTFEDQKVPSVNVTVTVPESLGVNRPLGSYVYSITNTLDEFEVFIAEIGEV